MTYLSDRVFDISDFAAGSEEDTVDGGKKRWVLNAAVDADMGVGRGMAVGRETAVKVDGGGQRKWGYVLPHFSIKMKTAWVFKRISCGFFSSIWLDWSRPIWFFGTGYFKVRH